MRANRLLGIVVATTLAITVIPGSVAGAANLGPQGGATLGAWKIIGGTGAPTVATWANFTGANGTSLSGYALNGGGAWSVAAGTWTIRTNQADATRTARAKMTANAGTQNASVLVTLNLTGAANAGVAALDNGAVAIYALYSKSTGGTVTLYKYNGGPVVLTTATGVGTFTSTIMKLDALTNTIKVSLGGTQVLSYTLTAAEVITFKAAANNRFGLMADSDNVTRFDDFHIDT